jgi:hypothetical protein
MDNRQKSDIFVGREYSGFTGEEKERENCLATYKKLIDQGSHRNRKFLRKSV